MNVEIWTEAAQLPEKEYINGFFLLQCGTSELEIYRYEVQGLENYVIFMSRLYSLV
jgi:hypothetical protein